ncbi:MAG: DNA double-strand break repair nuclease NurA [Cyanobacteria bacterium Co-bin8]|nr:DNA double-strand break repair nuclease NurA [Cyanobacteria bacterium Co-bin8]
MLDLMKIAQQMRGISEHLTQEAEAARRRVIIANQLMERATEHQSTLLEQWEQWCDRIGFAVAQPIEPLHTRVALQAAPEAHTVLATDGSQIAPSHHEIAYCYLLNIGRIVLHYGQSRYPLLDSLPEVVYRPEDLYMSRQWGISTEEWMGHRRTVAEAVVLGELAKALRREEREEIWGAEGQYSLDFSSTPQPPRSPAPSHPPSYPSTDLPSHPPTLALVDGSLIYWFLDQLPAEARDHILPPILEGWEQLRQLRIPLVGYLSASRSGEALNFLRLEACPYEQPDCTTHCGGQTDTAPCQVFSPLKDATYWATALEPGQRGPLWQSSAPILDHYGEHRIFFCYVHVGAEVARVEMPAWVVEDAELLETALQLTLTQVQKGYGYPVALAEAHNQAVVRGGDRTRFFALLEREMIRAGLKNVGTSYKEARKRGSIA